MGIKNPKNGEPASLGSSPNDLGVRYSSLFGEALLASAIDETISTIGMAVDRAFEVTQQVDDLGVLEG